MVAMQIVYHTKIPKELRVPTNLLAYDPIMKYRELRNYWNSVNSQTMGANERGVKTMLFRPTGGIIRELRKFEELYEVPDELCIKDNKIYTPLPN